MRRRVVLPTGRFEQFVELQFGGQGNLRQGLLGSDGRDARRSLLAQWRVQQIDALDRPSPTFSILGRLINSGWNDRRRPSRDTVIRFSMPEKARVGEVNNRFDT